jgi:hypothetical protein
MRTLKTFLALTLAIAACGKKADQTPPSTGSGSAMAGSGSTMAGSGSAMAGSGSAMAGSDQGSGGAAMAGSGSAGSGAGSGDAAAMAHHAGNCPSTVLNSTTTAAVKGKDVIVTISSTDKDSILAIQKRTDEMLKARMGKTTPGEAHDQRGTHGGKIGLCPVHIPEGATVKSKHEKSGVVVTITPTDKPDDLKKEVDERITKSADWVKANIKPADKGDMGGVGGGKGDHGSNHSGQGDSKGKERKGGDGKGTGGGTGGGGGKGTGGGSGSGDKKK